MRPFVEDSDFTLYVGDVGEVLATLPDESVHCVVTSPPYWGLRDYGTGEWEGGDAECDHKPNTADKTDRERQNKIRDDAAGVFAHPSGWIGGGRAESRVAGAACRCGATRKDRQLGLEPTPEEYVANMVEVFREVRRVLRKDGTCWVNLGDTYNSRLDGSHGGWNGSSPEPQRTKNDGADQKPKYAGKPKDLVGIPWRIAFALQADGWYLRSDIIWSKPNPMPESVTDRPTKAHEYVFLLTKSPRYFFDQEAVRESYTPGSIARHGGSVEKPYAEHGHRGTVPPGHPTEHHLDKHHSGLGRNGGLGLRLPPQSETLLDGSEDIARIEEADSREWIARIRAREWPWDEDRYYRDFISTGLSLPHAGHDGIPGAPGGVYCIRCEADRALDRFILSPPRPETPRGPDGRRKTTVQGSDGSLQHRNGERWPNAGRNIRSVWEIATQPYPEAHFATYPEALVERCLKAGCPEWVCGTCGKARERIIESEIVGSPRNEQGHYAKHDGADGTNHYLSKTDVHGSRVSKTLGFTDCGHDDYRSGVVLDPFLGSGTTALVARKHGRRCIGIELSPEYAALAAKRLSQLSLLA